MCLHSRYNAEELAVRLPKQRFYGYKKVNVSKAGDHQVYKSPVYPYLMSQEGWKPTVHSANLSGGADAGFYFMLVEPGLTYKNDSSNTRIMRVEIDPADVLFAGPDNFIGHKASCVVCKQVTLTEADYKDLQADAHGVRMTAVGVEIVKAAVEKAAKTRKKTEASTAKVVKKAAKKVAAKKKATENVVKKAVRSKAEKKRMDFLTHTLTFDEKALTSTELKELAKLKGHANYSKLTRAKLLELLR